MRCARLCKVFLSLTVAFLAGCTSLPLPGSHDESLLVIPLRWDTYDGGGVRGNAVQLTLSLNGSNRTYSESAPAGSSLISFALPPGQYRVESALVLYTVVDGNDLEQEQIGGMRGRAILVGDLQVIVWDGAIEVEYDGWITASNAPTGAVSRLAVSNQLRSDPRWAAWETHRRVGFASGG